MLRVYENNYNLLSKMYKQEQNAFMTHRLKNVKSTIKAKSPKYFNNFRKKILKSPEQKDLSKSKIHNLAIFSKFSKKL